MNDSPNPTTIKTSGKLTANDIVAKYRNSTIEEISNETPDVISAEIVILASKLWEVGTHTIKCEQLFSEKWVNVRTEVETDGQADKSAKRSLEYAELQKARLQEKVVLEIIRALKKLLSSKGEEAKNIY